MPGWFWGGIPNYRRADLHHIQSVEKSVFEYWTHALAYVPISDFRFYLPQMRQHRRKPVRWNQAVAPKDYHRVIRTIRENGPITPLSLRGVELTEIDAVTTCGRCLC